MDVEKGPEKGPEKSSDKSSDKSSSKVLDYDVTEVPENGFPKSLEKGFENPDPSFALSIVRLVFLLGGLALGVAGVVLVVESSYAPPPIPVGHILANLLVLPGVGLVLSSSATLAATLAAGGRSSAVTRSSFALAWGLGLAAFGIARFWVDNPYTLPGCPCRQFSANVDGVCKFCAGYEAGVCDDDACVCGAGVCSETTAECVCSANWRVGANGTCSECSERARDGPDGECTRCTKRFKPNGRNGECSRCRNGYAGEGCRECHPNFLERVDDDGAVVCTPVRGCKDDQAADGGRFGAMCEAVPESDRCGRHGDVNAVVAKTNNNLVLPATFSSTGESCSYDFECASYNCLGRCVTGLRRNALCSEDDDCLGGLCRSRTCGVEHRVGEDTCQCSRSGWLSPRCESCPGYNKVTSSSVCAGRGVCAARYSSSGAEPGFLDVYERLECLCSKPAGVLEEYPVWSGAKCQRAVDANGQTAKTDEGENWCAEGFFGPLCEKSCPAASDADSWGGAGACDSRGTCKFDGQEAHCVCDADERPGGVGFFAKGPEGSCTECWQNFWGVNCQSCPLLQPSSDCDPSVDMLLPPDMKNCINACSDGTCEDGKTGRGVCDYTNT